MPSWSAPGPARRSAPRPGSSSWPTGWSRWRPSRCAAAAAAPRSCGRAATARTAATAMAGVTGCTRRTASRGGARAASSERAAPDERLAQGDLVGVLEVGADREPGGEARDRDVGRALARRRGDVQGGRLAGRGRVGRQHDLADRAVAHARIELGDLQVLGVDAVDRRQRAAEDVVAPAVLVGALDGDDIAGLLDDADEARVAALVLADAAARLVGQVEAHLAQADALLDLADRVGQRVGVLGVAAQDVEGQALSGALADAGQLAQLGDEALDGRRIQALEARQAQ